MQQPIRTKHSRSRRQKRATNGLNEQNGRKHKNNAFREIKRGTEKSSVLKIVLTILLQLKGSSSGPITFLWNEWGKSLENSCLGLLWPS